jgi:hypothetical protein
MDRTVLTSRAEVSLDILQTYRAFENLLHENLAWCTTQDAADIASVRFTVNVILLNNAS